ncbi:MAG: ComEC/Rec2 family competence protein [Cyanobium sp.]
MSARADGGSDGSSHPWAGWIATGFWALLLALVLLRAALLSGQPLPLAPGDPARLLAADAAPPELALQGRLLADPRASADGSRCTALLQLAVGRTELEFSPCPDPAPQEGWQLRVWGRLRLPTPAAHPLLSGAAERLGQQQAASQLRVSEWQVLGRPPTPVADLRRRLAAALIERAGPERGGVLAALVLGSAVVPLPAELRELFRASGLSHALAASGFHLSVLLGAVLPLARRLPRLPRLLLLGAAMGLFVLLAGPQPSVLRAVLMAAISLLALECGRRARPLAALLASVLLLLLIWPRWLVAVGFQLSAVATAALVLSAGPLEQGLRRWLPSWCGPWLAPAVAVPLAACLYTLPLQLLHFGVVPVYALLANLLAAPLLTPLTLGAMALALLAVVLPPLLGLLLPPLAALAGLLLLVVRLVAGLPMAQWQLQAAAGAGERLGAEARTGQPLAGMDGQAAVGGGQHQARLLLPAGRWRGGERIEQQHPVEARHPQAAAQLAGLVAAEAIGLQGHQRRPAAVAGQQQVAAALVAVLHLAALGADQLLLVVRPAQPRD